MTIHRRIPFLFLLLLLLSFASPLTAQADITFQAPSSVSWGEAFVVRVRSDLSLANAKLVWLNKTIPLQVDKTKQGYTASAILGTDVKYSKPGPQSLGFSATVGKVQSSLKRTIQVEPKKYKEQHLAVAKKMVNPSKKSLGKIQKESRLMGKALATLTPERYWSLPFTRPVKGGISSEYGLRRFYNEQPRSPHRGVDLRGAKGTPIKAVNAGRVVLKGKFYFGGNTVFIDHGQGLISMYCHMSKIKVKQGAMVSKGEVIGLVGSTGRVTGPHLHLSIFSAGQSSNPLPLFTPEFGKEKTAS
ncbi:MAG: M23 family metallopeptidase [Desulfovibrio sp.]|uniref:M23 family metallopeptidase n=1 Tax=Desulfovibrio sp. 7SRBS1 TaxID=3378064 RepID=UPI003B403B02